MKQEIRTINNQVVVTLTGSMYVEEASALREKLLEHIEQGNNHFAIHLENVDYIDSSGLGVLVNLQKRALQNGGRVKLQGLKGTVKEIFELTRLDKVFEIQ